MLGPEVNPGRTATWGFPGDGSTRRTARWWRGVPPGREWLPPADGSSSGGRDSSPRTPGGPSRGPGGGSGRTPSARIRPWPCSGLRVRPLEARSVGDGPAPGGELRSNARCCRGGKARTLAVTGSALWPRTESPSASCPRTPCAGGSAPRTGRVVPPADTPMTPRAAGVDRRGDLRKHDMPRGTPELPDGPGCRRRKGPVGRQGRESSWGLERRRRPGRSRRPSSAGIVGGADVGLGVDRDDARCPRRASRGAGAGRDFRGSGGEAGDPAIESGGRGGADWPPPIRSPGRGPSRRRSAP